MTDGLEEYAPVQLANTHLIDAFWPLVKPLFERCIDRAMHNEYNVDHIKQMVLQGKLTVIVITNDRTGEHPDRDVQLAIAVEPVTYPKLPAINIMAIGGTRLALLHGKFWDQFKGWAYMNGARAIEAYVQPGMRRIIERWEFKPVYTVMRLSLMESGT